MDNSKSDSIGSQISQVEHELSRDASLHYHAGNHELCYGATIKLCNIEPSDPKVMVNKALIEYIHKSGCRRTTDYIAELQRMATCEGIQLTDTAPAPATENGAPDTPSSAPIPILPPSDLAITLLYNYALTLFYQKLYLKCERVLSNCLVVSRCSSPVPSRNELDELNVMGQYRTNNLDLTPSTDVTLCRRILILWLEVLLCLQKPERVFEMCDNWLALLSSFSIVNMLAPISPVTTRSSASTPRGLSTQATHVLNGIQQVIQIFYVRACLLTGRLYAAKQELDQLSSTMTDDKSSSPDVQSHKGRLTIDQDMQEATPTTSNLGDSKEDGDSSDATITQDKEDSQLMSSDEEWGTSSSILFLQAQLAYLLGEYAQALGYLSSIPLASNRPIETGQCELTLVCNNLGLVHHRIGQFNLSGLHLRRALRNTNKLLNDVLPSATVVATRETNETEEQKRYSSDAAALGEHLLNQVPVQTFSLMHHHTLLYNLGLQLLFSRRPSTAFTVLLQLTSVYPRNPRLWYRLAECCIKVSCPDNLSAWQMEARERCVVKAVGGGASRKLMLISQPLISEISSAAASVPSPSLEFAFLCLRNAAVLLPRLPSHEVCSTPGNDADSPFSSKSLLNWAQLQSVPVLPTPASLRGPGLLHLLSAVNLASVYVALCLHHPVEAVRQSTCLLAGVNPIVAAPSAADQVTTLADPDETAKQQRLYSAHCQGCCSSFCPPAYRFLARLYLAEAMSQLDQLTDAVSLLSNYLPTDSATPHENVSMSDVIQKGICSVDLSSKHLIPILPMQQNDECVEGDDAAACPVRLVQSSGCPELPGRASIWSVDFPATPTHSAALLLYNLAALLAIEPQWRASAQIYLESALPGLRLSPESLTDRRCNNNSSFALLPLPAIFLQIYLLSASDKSGNSDKKSLISLLRDNFGSLSLCGRYYGPSSGELIGSQVSGWTVDNLRQMFKTNLPPAPQPPSSHQYNIQQQQQVPQFTNPGSVAQRPNSLWVMNPQHQQYMDRWEPAGLASSDSSAAISSNTNMVTTGIITSANESDWPPL